MKTKLELYLVFVEKTRLKFVEKEFEKLRMNNLATTKIGELSIDNLEGEYVVIAFTEDSIDYFHTLMHSEFAVSTYIQEEAPEYYKFDIEDTKIIRRRGNGIVNGLSINTGVYQEEYGDHYYTPCISYISLKHIKKFLEEYNDQEKLFHLKNQINYTRTLK